jgi:hypothetical protein
LKHEKHGGGGAMGLSILLVAATRNPNGVQKCDEWVTAHQDAEVPQL